MKVSRREFIRTGSLAGGGLLLSFRNPLYAFDLEDKNTDEIEFNKFLSIDKTGMVTIMLTKHEMGQGTGTAVPMILADELGANWDKVQIVQADYDPKYSFLEMGTTGGSGSIMRIWKSIREAGATARLLLTDAAAKIWNVDTLFLKAKNGFVINQLTGDKLEFGELAESASKLELTTEIEFKDPKDYQFIGKSVKNRITEKLIVGELDFGIDMDLKDMLYASIEKCPVYKGKLVSFEDSDARAVNGVIDVLPFVIPDKDKGKMNENEEGYVANGVVIIANGSWPAIKARKLLRIEWDLGEYANKDLESLDKDLIEGKLNSEKTMDIGNVDVALSIPENHIIKAEYNNPHQTHALMEPINATASYKDGKCEIWVGTQDGGMLNDSVSKVLNIPKENVIVHILRSGGSFGRRYNTDSSVEAAWVSRMIGKPVKMIWTREDEIRHDHIHPYLRNYFTAAISKENELVALENHAIGTAEEEMIWTVKWDHFYYAANIRCYHGRIKTYFPQGPWRSTGQHLATLGREAFIDEVANSMQKDPLDFRLELIAKKVDWGNPDDYPLWLKGASLPWRETLRSRKLKVINFIKENKLWQPNSDSNKGMGFAVGNFGYSVCAQIVEISKDDSPFGFKVNKVTAIVHCGMVVNPHFGKGQIEGSIIWGLTAALYGGIEVSNGVIQRDNFYNNKILTIDESPIIDVHFIASDERPSGLGEPGTPPLAPALLNAIYDLNGLRIRKIPIEKNHPELV